jgi:hypothetical protein
MLTTQCDQHSQLDELAVSVGHRVAQLGGFGSMALTKLSGAEMVQSLTGVGGPAPG